jgi:hypothetical protein
MSLLTDIVLELIGETILPESRKATLTLFGAISFGFALVIGRLIYVVPDPQNDPEWAPAAMTCAIVYGSAGLIASALSLLRDEPEKPACIFLLAVTAALVGMPVAWMIW